MIIDHSNALTDEKGETERHWPIRLRDVGHQAIAEMLVGVIATAEKSRAQTA